MTISRHVSFGFLIGLLSYFLFRNAFYSIGFLLGSCLIDIDHLWQYWWATGFSLKKILAVKVFFKFISFKTAEFKEEPFLHLLPMHTVEFLCLLYFLGLGSNSLIIKNLLWGSLIGCAVHMFLDDISLYNLSGNFTKRSHFITEFIARKILEKRKI